MRLRRNRIETFYHRKSTVKKNKEGGTYIEYDAAVHFSGESWQASSKVQAQKYGQRLNNIRNIRLSETYRIQTDEKGRCHYLLDNGIDLQELDGICIFTGKDMEPDYKVISIKPYRNLVIEVERL